MSRQDVALVLGSSTLPGPSNFLITQRLAHSGMAAGPPGVSETDNGIRSSLWPGMPIQVVESNIDQRTGMDPEATYYSPCEFCDGAPDHCSDCEIGARQVLADEPEPPACSGHSCPGLDCLKCMFHDEKAE